MEYKNGRNAESMNRQTKSTTIAMFQDTILKIDQLKNYYKKELKLNTLHRKQLVERLVNEAYEQMIVETNEKE